MKKKLLIIILDGASGLPVKSLNNKTTLEAASTPNMNKLALMSQAGLMDVIGRGIAPQSDAAAFALLGYNPFRIPGRGVTEAAGSGIAFNNGELAFRCNLACVEAGIVKRLRVSDIHHSTKKRIERLISEGVNLDVPFTFKFTVGYRAVLILHGRGLSEQVSNTHPGYEREKVGNELISVAKQLTGEVKVKDAKPLLKGAEYSAELINDFTRQSHEVLMSNDIKDSEGGLINYVLSRDAGNTKPNFESFYDKFKIMMGLVAEMPVELGIAKMLKLEVIKPPESLSDTAELVFKELPELEGLYVHLKGPDKFAHLGDAEGKKKSIADIDKEFMSVVLKNYNPDEHVVCITCDHSTPAVYGSHSSHPVPFIITSDKPDGVKRFTENECSKGSVKGLVGVDLMKNLVNRLKI